MKNGKTRFCIILLLCLMIGFAFSGCGKDSATVTDDMTPTQTVNALLEAFKSQDEDVLKQVYAGQSNDFLSAYEDGVPEDAISQELMDSMMSKWYDFDYKVTGEKIADDGKTATVDVTITTYDMVAVFNNFYQEFMSQALDQFTGKGTSVSEDEYEKMAVQILQEQIDGATSKDYEGKASLNLTQTDGRWIVDEITDENEAFLNAITGGLMDVLKDVVKAVGGDEEDD